MELNPLSADYSATCLVVAMAAALRENETGAATGLLGFALQHGITKENLLFVAAGRGECPVLNMAELAAARLDPKNWIHLVRVASASRHWGALRLLIGNSLSCTPRFRSIGNGYQLRFLCEAIGRNDPQELEAILRGTTTKDRDAIKFFIGKLPAFSTSSAQIDAALTMSGVSTPGV